MILTLCAVLSSQPMFKSALLSLISPDKDEDDEGGYGRFIPLLLFLVQKKETVIPAKLSVMVSHFTTISKCFKSSLQTILQSLLNVYINLSEPPKDKMTLQHVREMSFLKIFLLLSFTAFKQFAIIGAI